MEKRRKVMLKHIEHALYKEGEKKLEIAPSDSTSGSQALTADFWSGKHFTMHHKPANADPKPVDYAESRVDGPGSVLGKPIHGSDDPERAIMIMGLPPVSSGQILRMVVENPDGTGDTIALARKDGSFSETYKMFKDQGAKIITDITNVFFTVEVDEKTILTVHSLNQEKEYVELTYSNKEIFRTWQLSIMGMSTI